MLHNYFDHIFCINLINRPDRKQKMIKRFDKFGIKNVEFFTTVEFGFADKLLQLLQRAGHDLVNPGEISCAIAHYSIIKIAKERNYKNIFIFEDDCVFHKDFNNLLPKYMSILPEYWNMLFFYTMMYHNKCRENISYNDSDIMLFKPTEAHCASSYAINSNMYDTIIDSLDNDFRIIDSRYRLFMDYPDLNIYSVFPNLCGQESDISNIRGDGKTKLDYFSWVSTFGVNEREDYI